MCVCADKLVEELGEHIANIINMADEEQRLMELKEKEEAEDEKKDEAMDAASPQPQENITMTANGKCV